MDWCRSANITVTLDFLYAGKDASGTVEEHGFQPCGEAIRFPLFVFGL
jgi:hypothetical protein